MGIRTPTIINVRAQEFMKRMPPVALNRQPEKRMADYPKIETYLNRELQKAGEVEVVICVIPHEVDPQNEVYHAVSTFAEGLRDVEVTLGGAHPPVYGAYVLAVPGSRVIAVTSDPEGRTIAEVLVFYPPSHEAGFLLAAQVNFALDAGAPLSAIMEQCSRHGEVGRLVATLLEVMDGSQTTTDPRADEGSGGGGGDGWEGGGLAPTA